MMDANTAIRRAQVYAFLAGAFLYPVENWSEDAPLLPAMLAELGLSAPAIVPIDLPALQRAHRQSFGLAGSLCYETEYGLPHEFRQSQELADIAGFYRAFGFAVGGARRERADHLAMELEFMYALALKQAYALQLDSQEWVEVCVDAQARFLQDHLGHWLALFERSLIANGGVEPFLSLARLLGTFVQADAAALGVRPQDEQQRAAEIPLQHTPFDPDFTCAGCALAGAEPSAEGASYGHT